MFPRLKIKNKTKFAQKGIIDGEFEPWKAANYDDF